MLIGIYNLVRIQGEMHFANAIFDVLSLEIQMIQCEGLVPNFL